MANILRNQEVLKEIYWAHRQKKDKLFLKEVCRRIYGKEVKDFNKSQKVREHLVRLKNRGFVGVDKKNNPNGGGKNLYFLTDMGYDWAEELVLSEYFCSDCGEFKDEEEVERKPTCKDCGTPVKRKRKE